MAAVTKQEEMILNQATGSDPTKQMEEYGWNTQYLVGTDQKDGGML